MARKLYEKQAIRRRNGQLANGVVMVVYTGEAGVVPADISATLGGSAIPGSEVTTADIAGLGPASLRFYGPSDGTDTLYLRVPSDASLGVQKIEADPDPRLDALESGSASGIPGSVFDVKGDLIAATAADTAARLPAGTTGQILVTDPSATTGLRWMVNEGPLWMDDPRVGGVLDGVTDDGAAYDVAKAIVKTAHASGAVGGAIGVPPRRCLLTNRALYVPAETTLIGVDRGASVVKAGGSFPSSTPLIRLGEGAGANVHGSRVEHLLIDANNVTGSIGVYSNEAQEMSGVFWCAVVRSKSIGVHLDTGCENCGVGYSEIYPTTGSAAGIRFQGVVGAAYVERSSVVEVSGSGTITTALDVLASTVGVRSFHVERCDNGVYYQTGSNGYVDGVVGHPSVTNLVRNDATTYLYSARDLLLNGATNAVYDQYNGVTLSGAGLDASAVSFYTPRRHYFGAGSLRPGSGTAVQIDGQLHFTDSATNLKWGAAGFLRTDAGFDAAGRITAGYPTGTYIQLTTAGTIDFGTGPTIRGGAGTPEAVVTAPVGSLFLRSDGAANTTLYIKQSGTGNTGWAAVTP